MLVATSLIIIKKTEVVIRPAVNPLGKQINIKQFAPAIEDFYKLIYLKELTKEHVLITDILSSLIVSASLLVQSTPKGE